MIKLIKNEFKKLTHKKSFYIVTFIFILFTILTNLIYKDINYYPYTTHGSDIEALKESNENLNLNDLEDLSVYVSNLTSIELEELRGKYTSNEQGYLIDEFLYDYVYNYYQAKYITKDEEAIKNAENKKDEMIKKVENHEWKTFVEEEISELKLIMLEDEESKEISEYLIDLKEYRLNNNIPFDYDNYLNNALESVEIDLQEYLNLKNRKTLTKDEKARLEDLEESMTIHEYILKEKVDINNYNTLRGVLENFANEFGLFILIYVVMISGSIVSEEYNKGTIKSLLTKPYKRRTILTSKLLTIFIALPLILMMMYLIEFIVGGIVFGFESLSIPILVYDHAKNILISYNVFAYSIRLLISLMPMYIVIMILCFMLSTITASTSAAITISFMFYLAGNVISTLAVTHKFKILKAFVSCHWDFSYLITLSENPLNIKPLISLGVVGLYIFIMLLVSYIYFHKKDVKNI